MKNSTSTVKQYSIQGSFALLKDDDLLQYLRDVDQLQSFMEDLESQPRENISKEEWLSIHKTISRLKAYADIELFERFQFYRACLDELPAFKK